MIYLVNPSERRILDNAGDRIPIGLLSIASQLQKQGERVRLFDLNHVSYNLFLSRFYKDKPKVVGISVYTSPIIREAIGLAENLKGETKTIAGGHHATHMPGSLAEHFDLVVRGEGENVGPFLKKGLKGVASLKSPNLNDISNLDYSLLNMQKYGMNQSGRRTATLITSRGCPYSCAFCGKISNKVRHEPIDKILEQIENLKKYGFEALYFLDDVFTLNQGRMEEILRKVKLSYRITTRADLLNEGKIEFLAKNGCDWISLGIESGNDRILQKSNKQTTTSQNYEAVRLAGEYGLNTKGFFIIGLPGETEQTAKETIEFSKYLKSVGLTKADFYFLTPFPGTDIWSNPQNYGIEITDRDYTKYLEAGKGARCYVNTEHLPAKKIEELVKEARAEWK